MHFHAEPAAAELDRSFLGSLRDSAKTTGKMGKLGCGQGSAEERWEIHATARASIGLRICLPVFANEW